MSLGERDNFFPSFLKSVFISAYDEQETSGRALEKERQRKKYSQN